MSEASQTPAALDIVDQSDDRLVIHIPPQSSSVTRGLGGFAVAWTVFSSVVSTVFLFVRGQPQQGDLPTLALLVPLLFVAIGLGMLYAWARMRHSRVFVLVDPARVAIQRLFLGRKRETEMAVGPVTHATLVEAYSVNEVPVHAIAVRSGSEKLQFGTGLSEADKQWVVDRINAIVCPPRPADEAPVCAHCGTTLRAAEASMPLETICPACGQSQVVRPVATTAGPAIPEIRPERGDAVPEEIVVEETHGDELAFAVPLIPVGAGKKSLVWALCLVVPLLAVVVGPSTFRAWMNLLGAAPPAGRPPLAFTLFEVIHGTLVLAAPAVVLLTLLRGQIRVRLTRDVLAMRWGWGWIGVRRRTPLDSIREVRLIRLESHWGKGTEGSMATTGSAAVIVNDTPWVLTTFHAEPVALAAAGLVETRLRDWNVIVSTTGMASDPEPESANGGGSA